MAATARKRQTIFMPAKCAGAFGLAGPADKTCRLAAFERQQAFYTGADSAFGGLMMKQAFLDLIRT